MTPTHFSTDDGALIPSVTAEQMRLVDRIAIEHHAPNLFQMMENAGRSMALSVIDRLGPGWPDLPILVLAGPGGNGGGGICAARHLANHGGDVVLVLSDDSVLSPVTQQQLGVFAKTPGRIGEIGSIRPGVVVDALIGYGLRGAPRPAARKLIESVGEIPAPVVSLDVPSGLDSTTGEAAGAAIVAEITVTLALPKTGLSSHLAGDVWLADLGISGQVFEAAGITIPQQLFDGRHRLHLRRLG